MASWHIDLEELKQTQSLGFALTDGLQQYLRQKIKRPGIYAGWDPAKINDASAFTILAKDMADVLDEKAPLNCYLLKDLSIDYNGQKTVSLYQQAQLIIKMDTIYKRITHLVMDCTNEAGMLDLLKEHFGSRITGVKYSKPQKMELIRDLRFVMQEQLVQFDPTHRNFPKLRRELYELDPTTLKHPEKGSDDFVWSLAMALRAVESTSQASTSQSGFESDVPLIF